MNQISFTEARHLLSRTVMGVEWSVLQQMVGKMSRSEAVNRLINTYNPHTQHTPHLTSMNRMDRMIEAGARGKKLMQSVMMRENDVLKQWWVKRMLTTQSPFTERMTLFWHNHFTSSLASIQRPQLLLNQNKLLRQHGMGSFASMLKAIARDPAMLLYLDGEKNVIGSPNENFARELQELFTLGRGHYSEADVKAVAIAFTGWSVDHHTGKYIYRHDLHDNREVVFLGHRGRFSGDDIINIILDQPRTAEFIAEKFWKNFINLERPNERVIKQWAAEFRSSNYNIGTLLKSVLDSDDFWAEKNRGALVKSPIELIVGTMRTLPHRSLTVKEITHISRILGQDLFDPPNVKGWDGGNAWITTQSLLIRTSLQHKMACDANIKVMSRHFPNEPLETMEQWLLPQKPVLAAQKRRGELWKIQNLLFDPGYQLT